MKKQTEITQEYVNAFLEIKTIDELAKFLSFRPNVLEHLLFYASDENKYSSFSIKKRNGMDRPILAPKSRLKNIQETLQEIFQFLYSGKPSVHGFVSERSIVTNAKLHVNKKVLINIDLKNFFQTINFGRIRSVFMYHPFNLNMVIANALARLCCHGNCLPQGAPTSPILSNFVCRKLDNDFMKLSKYSKMTYTRYADDISISTNLKVLSKTIGVLEPNQIVLSREIKDIIQTNGFTLNQDKVRYSLRHNRQEVTGLIVNKFPNVRRSYLRHIKSMLHAWEKFGLEAAAAEHFAKFNPKNYIPDNMEFAFIKELTGKINFVGVVRGREDEIYEKLYRRIKVLEPTVILSIVKKEVSIADKPIIFTEGKTDVKHLERAFKELLSKGQFLDINLHFHHYQDEDKMSNGELLKFCETFSKGTKLAQPVICIFDRDDPNYMVNVTSTKKVFKDWGNKTYSMVLPVPSHRDFSEICIEHFYTDKELVTKDQHGRRFYLSNEFNPQTGKHVKENLSVKSTKKLQSKRIQLLDNGVYNEAGISVALSKNHFAEHVHQKIDGFGSFNFDKFRLIFDTIQEILTLETGRGQVVKSQEALKELITD